MTIKLVIPRLPESWNKLKNWGKRHRLTGEWQHDIYYSAYAQGVKATIPERACVRITCYFPTKRRRDPSNYLSKSMIDALVNNGFLKDDDQAHCIIEEPRLLVDAENPRTEIVIEEIA